jgi:uncharacterized membrane protein
MQLAAEVRTATAPRALFAAGLQHNHPVSVLAGRRVLMGFTGVLWSLGLDYQARERDLRAIFALAPGAADLIRAYRLDYVVIGPYERERLDADLSAFRERYRSVLRTPSYEIFAVGGSSD